MITRMSTLFLRTLREDPADAEFVSHKLLVRAGYIRRVAPGIYTWLPLGLKALRRLESIVREEMDAIGGQELLFPALLPREPYDATNRWREYGDNLFRLQDRKNADLLLGPTHEEMFATAVKDMFGSYKDFPVTLYQIQTKYRDEERPRAGILRGREFLMKDSYSFDLTDEGLDAAYQRHRDAYQRIFDRVGIDYAICQATSGAMGGSASEEFLAISPSGEDTFVSAGDYTANVEAVTTQPGAESDPLARPAAEEHETPDAETIDALVEWANKQGIRIAEHEVTAADTLKTVLVKIQQPAPVATDASHVSDAGDAGDTDGTPGEPESELVGLLIPGDRGVDMKRLEATLEPATAELADAKDFAAHGLVRGYLGPRGLASAGIRILADPRVVRGTSWIAGADKKDHHVVGLVAGRDFEISETIEAAEVKDGDIAPNGEVLSIQRGIELGHIFQLGRKYTEAFKATILDENGRQVVPTMGSYGIGVSRMLAVLAEQNHDDKGLIWPAAAAPYQVHVTVAAKGEEAQQAGDRLVASLSDHGMDVLYDDRPKVSPGVRFKDAELLGMPLIAVVGRAYAEGKIELRIRGGETLQVTEEEIVAKIIELLGYDRQAQPKV